MPFYQLLLKARFPLMRINLFLGLTFLFVGSMSAQSLFPIKVDKRWGLINADGEIVVQPVYQAIGDFKASGYAVMQRNGGVGVLDPAGNELLPPRFEDVKVLTARLITVMEQGRWRVVNDKGQTVLENGYDQLKVLNEGLLAFQENQKWGLVNDKGHLVADSRFDQVEWTSTCLVLTTLEGRQGLLSASGQVLLSPRYDEIRFLSDQVVVLKQGQKLGFFHVEKGRQSQCVYDDFEAIDDRLLRLQRGGQTDLFHLEKGTVLDGKDYDQFFPFSDGYILGKQDRLLGLLDSEGHEVLPPVFAEIQYFGRDGFRVNKDGKWGVLSKEGEWVLDPLYDYIAPLREAFSLVVQGQLVGLLNAQGQVVVNPEYDRIEWKGSQIKAFQGESVSIFFTDKEGALIGQQQFKELLTLKVGADREKNAISDDGFQSQYVLDHFEWFYDSGSDKWGLRTFDGQVQIEPIYDEVYVFQEFGFTLVGMRVPATYDFERTTYRFDMRFGMVSNPVGLLVTEIQFLDIRLSDFAQGFPVARCIFDNGRHGLITRQGKIVVRDYAYIGYFREGKARMSVQGQVSGSMEPGQRSLGKLQNYLGSMLSSNRMQDFTAYDLEFEQGAHLICEGCEWGFLDTSGLQAIAPAYSFVRDYVNKVAMVQCVGKWGMLGQGGEELIPCAYDGIAFLENTDNRVVRIYQKREKYGLIDTLGQLAVRLDYDEIGSYREGRLAVKRNGMWGFVDRNGLEVIPCRFRMVENFSEGLAAVKLGRHWGYIDKQGNVELPFSFIRAGNFQDGMAWAYQGGQYGYIDRQGSWKIAPAFDKAHDFENGIARVVIDGKYGLIDPKGDWISRPRYSRMFPFDPFGTARVCLGGDKVEFGVVDRTGSLITQQGYVEIRDFQEGFAAVKDRKGYGFIDTRGKLVVPTNYASVSNFSNGWAAVQRDGRCGYINTLGEERIEPSFSKCLDFEDGKAVVYQGYRRAGLINEQGQFIIEPSINRLYDFSDGRGLVRDEHYRFYYITEQAHLYEGYYEQASSFQHGVAVVQSEGRWGIINQNGIEVIPPKYDKIEAFEEGYAKVRIQGFQGLSNLQGELIVQPDYEYISYAGEGLFRVEQGDRVGYFDMEGKWVWGLNN
jgi:hypothetical protein